MRQKTREGFAVHINPDDGSWKVISRLKYMAIIWTKRREAEAEARRGRKCPYAAEFQRRLQRAFADT
jgi:hypothetical protein